MLILGVDPSLRNTGFSVWDTDTFRLVWQGTHVNPAGSLNTDTVVPYVKIRDAVKAVIQNHDVKLVCVEQMFQSRNPKVTQALFVAQFTVKLACHDMGIPFYEVGIMGKDGWKNFVLGAEYTKYKGNISKKHTRYTLEVATNVKFQSEHVADSVAIALAGWYLKEGIDFRTVLGIPIPEGVGIAAAKKPSIGGRKRRASKTTKPIATDECAP